MSEDFSLKWNDHHNLFFVGAEELCEAEEYTDVTLAAEEKFFPAHKLVLSICSPYFRSLFKRLGRDKAVIFLKDVDPRHLDLLLQYMYKGEIKVKEDELVAVLSTAQSLEIRGLSGNNDKEEKSKDTPDYRVNNEPEKRDHIVIENTDSAFKKRKLTHANEVWKETKSSTNQVLSQQIPQSSFPKTPEILEVKKEMNEVTIDMNNPPEGGQNGEHIRQELSYCQDLSSGFDISEDFVDRDYEGDFGQEGSEHFEVFESGLESTKICPYCHKEFKKLSSLKQHLPVHTKEKNFECNICNASYTRSSSLYSHMRQKHQNIVTHDFNDVTE